MVRIYVSDAEGVDLSFAEAALPPEVREHISGKDAEHRAERALAYLMLSVGYRECFGEDLPGLLWDEMGKPHLARADGTALPPAVSISHSGGIAAVAIASGDISSLGVDVEEHRELVSREKIEKRLLSFKLDEGAKKIQTEIFRARIAGTDHGDEPVTLERITVAEVAYDSSDDGRFFDKWTVLEALLKADGGGFASVARAEKIAERAMLSTVRLTLGGKELSLSVAALGSR